MKQQLRIFLPVLVMLYVGACLADSTAPEDAAMALLKDGKRQEALHAFESILAGRPADPTLSLLYASAINVEDGKWRDARPLIRQLVRLRPAMFEAWELLVQVDQAANDISDRNAAIRSLYAAWRSALDPRIRSRIAFTRDRIFAGKHPLLVQETLDPGGDDIVRFVFQPVEEGSHPAHIIIVRSDNETNMRWRENGTVSYGTVVYHLDTVERLPNGRQAVRPYEFYLEPPDYDRVRAKVMDILSGSAQPLSGEADPYWAGDEPAKP